MGSAIFLKGLIIGLSIAAPVGPIGVLCMTRSLHQGFKTGLVTGLGAATADGVYGAVAAFGLTTIAIFLQHYQGWMQIIGGLFLGYLGIKTALTTSSHRAAKDKKISLLRAYLTTVFLTLTNPMTIFSFLGIFAGLGLGSVHTGYLAAAILVIGVIMGSFLWWLLLSGSIAMLHTTIKSTFFVWINRIAGAIIFSFGLIILGKLI